MTTFEANTSTAVTVRELRESDLLEADRIMRDAFSTFTGMPDMFADTDYIRNRWLADPRAAFAAERGGELVGSNFAVRWGAVGFVGPLTVRPDLWDSGIGQRLMAPVVDTFDRWGSTLAGLFTFPYSFKHLSLYQKFGFWPRYLTPIMVKPVLPARSAGPDITRYSAIPAAARPAALDACAELTATVHDGLDLCDEIAAVADRGLGDTLMLDGTAGVEGVAVCHCGPRSLAGSDTCYVVFGTVRPGDHAAFERLLDACESYAAAQHATTLIAGVCTARRQAYRAVLTRGFRAQYVGVMMHRPDQPGYNAPDSFVLDDWR